MKRVDVNRRVGLARQPAECLLTKLFRGTGVDDSSE
jgi:hypothetical protein